MGLLKKFFTKRILRSQIEKLKLQNEKFKLRNSIYVAKQAKKSKEVENFLRTAEDIEDLKGVLHAPENPIISFLKTPQGVMIAEALIAKFGGGSGTEAGNKLGEFIKVATPEQKAKGLKLIQEVLNNTKNNPIV